MRLLDLFPPLYIIAFIATPLTFFFSNEPIASVFIWTIIPLGIAGVGFFIAMIIDCILRPLEQNRKVMWIVLIAFFQTFAAIIYYYIHGRKPRPSSSTTPQEPPRPPTSRRSMLIRHLPLPLLIACSLIYFIFFFTTIFRLASGNAQPGAWLPLVFLGNILFTMLWTAFKVWMIIDCAMRPLDQTLKVVWIVLLILFPLLPSIIYFYLYARTPLATRAPTREHSTDQHVESPQPRGSTLAIIAFILAFIPIIQMIALILGIVAIANLKGTQAGFQKGLAIAAVVISGIGTFITLFVLTMLTAFIHAFFASIDEPTRTELVEVLNKTQIEKIERLGYVDGYAQCLEQPPITPNSTAWLYAELEIKCLRIIIDKYPMLASEERLNYCRRMEWFESEKTCEALFTHTPGVCDEIRNPRYITMCHESFDALAQEPTREATG